MTKKKPLTQKEKRLRAACKKDLQKKGVLPPDKPRLNRKKFASETWAQLNEMGAYNATLYMHKAIGCMIGPDMKQVDAEAVGVCKLLRISMETKKFMDALTAEGREDYTVGEYLDNVVLPIVRL